MKKATGTVDKEIGTRMAARVKAGWIEPEAAAAAEVPVSSES